MIFKSFFKSLKRNKVKIVVYFMKEIARDNFQKIFRFDPMSFVRLIQKISS